MCGIIGVIGKEEASPRLLEGLRRLEYRGYDSAGIATLHDGVIGCTRAEGKIKELEKQVEKTPLQGTIGIGHTRWATHGIPNTRNAHPHITDKVAVIHNGIIENFKELREELTQKGFEFKTETDTEVIPYLITWFLDQGKSQKDAVYATLQKLEGAFALGILFAGNNDMLMAARRGSPLAVGYGDGEMFLASDAYALAPFTSKLAYLEDGDWAEITRDSVTIYDQDAKEVKRNVRISELSGASIGKGNYRHYMLKEIYEQPTVIGQTLNSFYNPVASSVQLPEVPFSLKDVSKVTTAELRRDILIFAKQNPGGFMQLLNDPMLKLNATVQDFLDKSLIQLRNSKKEVWFNTPSNKKKMCNIPFGEDPMYIMTSYFQSDDGLEVFKHLKALAKNA